MVLCEDLTQHSLFGPLEENLKRTVAVHISNEVVHTLFKQTLSFLVNTVCLYFIHSDILDLQKPRIYSVKRMI